MQHEGVGRLLPSKKLATTRYHAPPISNVTMSHAPNEGRPWCSSNILALGFQR